MFATLLLVPYFLSRLASIADLPGYGAGVPHSDELLTVVEVARALRIHRSSVYDLFNRGALASLTVGGRRLVCRGELHRYIAERARESLPPSEVRSMRGRR